MLFGRHPIHILSDCSLNQCTHQNIFCWPALAKQQYVCVSRAVQVRSIVIPLPINSYLYNRMYRGERNGWLREDGETAEKI